MQARIEQELALLRQHYPDLEYVVAGHWIRIQNQPTGPEWNRTSVDIASQFPQGYPGAPPYGIYVPSGLRCKDAVPGNYTEPANNRPPFAGEWAMFSWTPIDGQWHPTADLISGSNMLNFVQTFADRFREGA